MNNVLYSQLFTFKKDIYIKKPSTFANLLIEKPGNWFAVAKMRERHLNKKENLKKGTPSWLKTSLCDGF